ncbi:hypothetical protein [Methylophaga sp.]|jgi:hypothetical protein|uniref:hypothetical protein n=1 Tax=Methylophaga sp. TaxID=2024840 RepID=UPI003A8DAFE0
MLKQGFYTVALTTLFALSPAFAADDTSQHPAHKMDDSVSPKAAEIDQQAEYEWQKEKAAEKSNEGNHPAHEMGESAERINKESKDDYQENRLNAVKEGNAMHPAHEMDEVEPVQKRGQ